jgi:hypothetical protein
VPDRASCRRRAVQRGWRSWRAPLSPPPALVCAVKLKLTEVALKFTEVPFWLLLELTEVPLLL